MRVGSLALACALILAHVVVVAPIARAAACGATGTPTTSVYLPNITKTLGGPDGWVTPFIVQNVGSAATTLEVSFYRFSDGSLVSCRSVPGLLPGTSFADVPNNDADLPDDSQFSVVVRSFGSQVVSVVNEHQGAGTRAEALSYVGLVQGATTVGLPYVAKAMTGWTTTMVIQNLGSATAAVTAAFTSLDGRRTATLARTVDSGRSQFIDPTVETGLVAGTEYAALLTSAQPIAVVVNAHNDAPTVSRPMGFSYNGVAATSGSMYLPYVVRNSDGSRTTRVLVQNVGSTDATPTLTFRSSSGAQATVTAPATVRSGRSWSFDPRFQANGTTSCPTAGTSTCIGTGQHGLVVTGGTFAVLGITLSAPTGMGMAAVRPATSRLYLPNITRTLGGASGWTTPVVLQSAGATSAVLRWYRFADGTLVVTQYVPDLVSGGTVRIDPRDVTGLEDGTQYAVVVDAAGGAAAAVLELNDLGGDGAMTYEGFPAAGTVSGAPTPASLSVSPSSGSVGIGAAQQFTATVRDRSGNAMIGVPVAWSVTPSTLGTIDENGLFVAGATAGSGTITARFGSFSATATVVVATQTITAGGYTFTWRATATADVYAERSITSSDAQTIATTVDADVASVQGTYGRAYSTRPPVYVFPTTSSYTRGLQTVLKMPADDATQAGANTAGVFYRSADGVTSVAVNWSRAGEDDPQTVFRHELTHMMIDQIARPEGDEDVPAWLNEGSARLQEFTIAGTDHWEMQNRYSAASMVAVRDYFEVSELASQDDWNARTGDPGELQYYEASQIAQLLRDDIGQSKMIDIFERLDRGEPFDAAFLAESGQPVAQWESTVPSRLQGISTFYPAIETADDEPGGGGLSYILYGFWPNTTVTIEIVGERRGFENTQKTSTVDAAGTRSSYLGPEWPDDTYAITATGLTAPGHVTPGVTVTVSVTAAKSSSVSGLSTTARRGIAGIAPESGRRGLLPAQHHRYLEVVAPFLP